MFGSRSQGKVYNFVHADEIWKDHVILEIQSQKRWTEQWGYLLDEYEKLQEGLLNIGEQFEENEDLAKEQEQVAKEQEQVVKELLKSDVVKEVTASQTTDELPVWKDDKITNILGRHMQNNARGKSDIVKLLKWPREGLE